MKTHKKIVGGLVGLAMLFSILSAVFWPNNSAYAATPDYLGDCAQLADQGFGVYCNLEPNAAQFVYGTVTKSDALSATYQAAFSNNSEGYPDYISLLNPSGNLLGDPTDAAKQTAYYHMAFDSTAKSRATPPTKYAIYKPGVGAGSDRNKFALLVQLKGTQPHILSLVDYGDVQSGKGSTFVYGWKIDQDTMASTSTGAACDPTKDAACAASATTTNSCEGSSNTGFEWIFCGVLRMFDSFVNSVTGMIENLLNFDTNQYLNSNVKKSWSIIRVIASTLLVLIMLVMVISQALGGSFLDAYTLRKMLPKLIVAVILMQISWYALIWVINIANDIGYGVRDLICAPFGGYGQMNLDKLVGSLGWAASGLTVTTLFTGIVVAGLFSGITIGGAALLGLSAVLSVVVGIAVLLLRAIFIILAVILFPIAIIMWILPGTQKYWKIWYDNFTKILILFPLIMALIYGGRIFASIAATSSHSGGQILALFMVFVGYFGPYWFLPKAFKWGGQLYGAAAGGAWNSTKGMRNFPGKYGLARAKDNRQFRAEERARRIGRNPVAASRWDQLLAGRYNVARSQGGRMRQYAHTVGEGQKTAREAVAEELTVSGYQNWDHDQKLDALAKWLRGESYAGINAEGNDELRLFAFKTLADLGDQDRIRKARHEGRLKGSIWLKGRAENISSLNQQASDMGIQADLSTVAPDSMAQWKSHTFKEWIRQVQDGVIMDNDDDGGGDLDIQDPKRTGRRDPAKRQAQLANAQAQAQRILSNQLVFDRLSSDQQEFVRRMATQENTQVAVAPRAGVLLPSGANMASDAAVRRNVISSISPGTGEAQQVANALGQQIVNANLNPGSVPPADQAGYEEVFRQVMDRGTAPDATPEMQRALSNLERAISASLAQHEAEVEQRLTASNSPNVSATLAAERAKSARLKTRLGI